MFLKKEEGEVSPEKLTDRAIREYNPGSLTYKAFRSR